MYLFRKILSLALAAMLFVSTTGFSVHAVYCHCKDKLTYTFLDFEKGEEACCSVTGKEKAGFFASEEPSCCGSEQGCCQESEKDHACQSEETIYARLASVFLTQTDQSIEEGVGYPLWTGPVFGIFPYSSPLEHSGFPLIRESCSIETSPFQGCARHIAFGNFRC